MDVAPPPDYEIRWQKYFDIGPGVFFLFMGD